MRSGTPIETIMMWEGRSIRLSYDPVKWGIVDHLEIQSCDGGPLPITETGYRSHFFGPMEPALTIEELHEYVHAWLDEAARDPKWKAAEDKRRQLSLF
ncbi:hypothetical protein [Hyphococcus sp.]|uniref:hypothetical protein n=1 Tax=Hyphococcus sp. TaxID=2038636 RepID=UPI003D097651